MERPHSQFDRRSDEEFRAWPIPEPGKSDTFRSVSWLTGHCALPTFPSNREITQWLLPQKQGRFGIALAAYSCRDSLGIGRIIALTVFPLPARIYEIESKAPPSMGKAIGGPHITRKPANLTDDRCYPSGEVASG